MPGGVPPGVGCRITPAVFHQDLLKHIFRIAGFIYGAETVAAKPGSVQQEETPSGTRVMVGLV